jgi:hypothetical protein
MKLIEKTLGRDFVQATNRVIRRFILERRRSHLSKPTGVRNRADRGVSNRGDAYETNSEIHTGSFL